MSKGESLRLLLVAAFLGAAGCRCGEDLTALHAVIAVDPPRIDFARQVVGKATSATFQVGNRGTGALTLDARVEGDAFALASVPDTIGPGLAARGEVAFTPPAQGAFTGTLVLRSNDADHPEVRVPLTGEGGPPVLTISPDPVDLGLVNEGPGANATVALENTGFDTLSLTSAALADGSAFALDASTLPAELPPGESVAVVVSLAPTAAMPSSLEDRLNVVYDGGQGSVLVKARVNLAPVAVAVEQVTRRTVVKVDAGRAVVIDGSETADPEGDPFSFVWSLPEQPAGSIAALVGQGQPTTQVTPDLVGDYAVSLRAIDVHGAYSDAEVRILPRDLAVVLTWDASGSAPCHAYSDEQCAAMAPADRDQVCCGQSDLDLHLVRPDGALGDYGTCPASCDPSFCGEFDDAHDACRQTGTDCAYANRAPDWGQAGRADDPRLDVDDVRGDGPEIAELDDPEDGAYRVVVHYCLDRLGDEPTLATLQVLEEGVVTFTSAPQLLQEGDAWTAATLVRSNGAWQIIAPPDVVEAAPAGLCNK